MGRQKNAYELSESQVTTPAEVVAFFWKLTRERRKRLGTVLDFGAGDCRFAHGGCYSRYVGVEIDPLRSLTAHKLPRNAKLIHNCAFRLPAGNYDACIGNPPYVRHHDIETHWKEKTAKRIEAELGIRLDKHCNLYLYFLCLGLLQTSSAGLVSLIIPYEWVSRPSAKAIRSFIVERKWDVSVYRFQKPIFDGVLTTASVSIVDKGSHSSRWQFYDIDPQFGIVPRRGIADSESGVLQYAPRGTIWGLRGLSPGSQKVFTLSEGERVHHGLRKSDVVPCVTTLKAVPRGLQNLTDAAFKKHFISAGVRCWLVKSYMPKRSKALNDYLESVPQKMRGTFTCIHQKPWFNFRPHPTPQLLVSSGFTKLGPKVLVNSVGAKAVGSVLGIHSEEPLPKRALQNYLLGINFEAQLVAHAKTLKKIEVKQMNSVLRIFAERQEQNAKLHS